MLFLLTSIRCRALPVAAFVPSAPTFQTPEATALGDVFKALGSVSRGLAFPWALVLQTVPEAMGVCAQPHPTALSLVLFLTPSSPFSPVRL